VEFSAKVGAGKTTHKSLEEALFITKTHSVNKVSRMHINLDGRQLLPFQLEDKNRDTDSTVV